MKKSEAIFGLLRIPLDALAVVCALTLSYRLRAANIDLLPRIQLLEPATTLPDLSYYFQTFVLPSMVTFIVIAAFLRLYALKSTESAWGEAGEVIMAAPFWIPLALPRALLVRRE